MGNDKVDVESWQILQYWWMLELFSPQRIPKPTGRSTRPVDQQVIEWRPGEPLPWDVLRPPKSFGRTRRRWQHTVYLGVYDLEETYQRLHRAFGEDRDAYDERRAGLSACAGILLDDRGALMVDSAVLSSALWAVARIGETASAQDPRWAVGFPAAAREFVEKVDAFAGSRRDAADAKAEPAHDEDSLRILLRIAHEATGVDGIVRLASERIVMASVAVSERRGHKASVDFLNSFFLEDLTAVQEGIERAGCPAALSAYLSGDASVQSEARIDVMTDHAATNAGVAVERLPKGRWPSKPEHGLALRQQFAVNQALNDLAGTQGLMGVNGPPGTGKTTMLRDVLAGNVVERARRLASLAHPGDAFTSTTHRWTAGEGHPRKVRQLREELTGFEMVVASANNAAVENVSTEIPVREAIAENWRSRADYFADIATAALEATGYGSEEPDDTEGDGDLADAADADALSAWGLVAARLGSRSNRSAFRSAFWFDQPDPRTKQRVPGTAPRMQTRLAEWRDGEAPHRSWKEAREAFNRAERRVDELIAERLSGQVRLTRLPVAIAEESDLAAQAARLRADSAAVFAASRAQARVLERADADHAEAVEARQRHLETRPGVFETVFTLGRAARHWRARLEPLEDRLQDVEVRRDRARSDAQRLDQQGQQLRERTGLVEKARERAEQEAEGLRREAAADRKRLGLGYPDGKWTGPARELRAPWLDTRLDEARSELFLAALRLHEDFLANAAGDMTHGLRAAIEVVAGAAPRRLEPEKLRAAWQTFFLVVPMVSTTFASFDRMFAGLGPESLGWLLIDEAGQASPQYAAGAIWRSQRVIAVGDPLQLQPVVTMPQKAQRDIASAYGVSPTWIPPRASVQTLADRVARHGTELRQGEESVWVSAPLTVHRRCDDPMFSLCNEIAYNGIMVSGVKRTVDDPEAPDLFDRPDGPRIAPSEWLDEPAPTAGTHLQLNQIARLQRELERLQRAGVALEEIIAISPFRAVADRLASLTRQHPGLRAGTIHTAQGREADVVFLVLGGDPGTPGAKTWASSTVNLVNVAASRAKRRLYVIGDRAAWGRHNYFHQLNAALRPARVSRHPRENETAMGHTANCETAKAYTCVCPCGGARHGAVLIRGIATADSAARDEARDWAEPRRWTRLSEETKRTTRADHVADRRPAMSGVVSELVIALIEQAREDGELDAVAALAKQVSEEIGDEFERHLDGGGPDHGSNRHLWCVVLAAICRLYDQGFAFAERAVGDLVRDVMEMLREDVSADRGEDTRARDVYYRHRIVAAFDLADYAFLEALIKRGVASVVAAIRAIGEEAVMKHLRLIGAITCPDPDRHPDVVKHCLWPLIAGPFRQILEESIATEMRTWLRNAYVTVPAG